MYLHFFGSLDGVRLEAGLQSEWDGSEMKIERVKSIPPASVWEHVLGHFKLLGTYLY